MKTIERLRELQDAFMRANTDDEVRRTGRDFGAEMVAKSDQLLAVVEAQAAEIRAWRDLWDAMKKDHNGPHTQKLLKKLAAEEKTDAALRALEGEGQWRRTKNAASTGTARFTCKVAPTAYRTRCGRSGSYATTR